MSKFLKTLMPAFVLALCGACQSYPFDEAVEKDEADVNFVIHVYAGDTTPGQSRAEDIVGSPDEFLPGSQYELMHTLRILIVRPDGTVEHNEYIYRSIPESGIAQYPDIRFKVVGGETKKVYVFANEASIIPSGNGGQPINFNAYPSGSKFPVGQFASMTMDAAAAGYLIDNSGTTRTPIPMSEEFDIEVKPLGENFENEYQSSSLFVTRIPVKFGFYFSTIQPPHEAFTIEEVRVSSLANQTYVLPNDAKYTPSKDLLGDYDRYIYDYKVPSTAVNAPYVFHPGIVFDETTVANQEYPFEPLVYLPETTLAEGNKFTVALKLSDNTEYYGELNLPNLPILPRNTFVKVNIQFVQTDLNFSVDLLPYTSVPLNPQFGFDELLPRPPFDLENGQLPPWVEIGPNK